LLKQVEVALLRKHHVKEGLRLSEAKTFGVRRVIQPSHLPQRRIFEDDPTGRTPGTLVQIKAHIYFMVGRQANER